MTTAVKPCPSLPAVPKTDGRRMKKLNNSVVSPLEGDNALPELKEKLPVTDGTSMHIVSLQNDFIPDEILSNLTSTVYAPDKLGPLKNSKTPKDFKVCGVHCKDSAWHHAAVRKKYQYLLDQPTSLKGAGRDISFLCDAMVSQREHIPLPSVIDRNSAQSQGTPKDMSTMETLIPEEYHIVKNRGVRALQCYEDKFTVLLEDEDKKLRVFPSLRPSGRLEAVQLMRVMDEMLDKAGVNQEFTELTELSQMKNLLELVQAEQNIYNVVFHELVRQVSVECTERGQLLAKLRQRYVALLARIPQQLKGLHTEMLAQRALDRRLTEEVICFKSSIEQLNQELIQLRDHDECVSNQAEKAKEELAKALEQSQKNADMVKEYHDLYAMQRRRLEGQVARVTEERDLWSRVTYSLALKVIKLNNLQLVNKLHVSEQTWTKTAEHFTAFLSAIDSEDMIRVTHLTDQWKEQLTGFIENITIAEAKQCEGIRSIQEGIVKWQKFCQTNVKIPDVNIEQVSEEELFADLKQWSAELTKLCERYGGEDLLSGQETLNTMTNLQKAWVEVGLELFGRHPGPDREPPKGQEAMRELSKAIMELHKQLETRINGESGIHKQLMFLVGDMELWVVKEQALSVQDWLKLEKALDSWLKLSEEALQQVDSTQPESERIKQKPHIKIEISDILSTLRHFIWSQTNFFDCENLRLCEEVNTIHNQLIRWMVDLLLQMVPDHCNDQETPSLLGLESSAVIESSVEKLEKDARNLAQKFDYISKYITCSCLAIVEEEVHRNKTQDETDNELHELNKLQKEYGEWANACRILLSDLTGGPVDLHLSEETTPLSVPDIPSAATSVESLTESSSVQEEQQSADAVEENDSQGNPIMKLIGHDGYIVEQTLGQDTVQLNGTSEQVICPQTANAQKAFDTLTTMSVLQQKLLDSEARAQSAEKRALQAEESLQAALVKIQDMERQLQSKLSLETKGELD
ncbi:axonemal dynein light chain domain-containing protein 1 [Chanos chanos]|uniref:Axonemal dynein light chain domain-containing protein 1 n=1 Tax=Chanos chanos TaxID=29144 RepID=A0A6J2WN29_CHACN|nr:axonemal dynein light chain domain-containing protein 1 [Chanos chanos]